MGLSLRSACTIAGLRPKIGYASAKIKRGSACLCARLALSLSASHRRLISSKPLCLGHAQAGNWLDMALGLIGALDASRQCQPNKFVGIALDFHYRWASPEDRLRLGKDQARECLSLRSACTIAGLRPKIGYASAKIKRGSACLCARLALSLSLSQKVAEYKTK